ncbi:MAG: Lysophospholipase [Alphaproteobacteria bacterium]|nr:Lysophospholipase [Alphaproteobacteria bacterium]
MTMTRLRLLAVACASLAAASAQAQAPAADAAPAAAPDYSQDSAWLCLPGRDDACGKPLPTTALNPNGYGSVGQAVAAKDAPVDCFYVYPTVSRDPGVNSDLNAGPEELAVALVQLARFGSVCRTYAPMYRQLTLASLRRGFAGENLEPAMDLAYRDVVAAWNDFLAHRNSGRPFVLIGHSQGSIHLERLIAEQIDGKKLAKQMVSAILLGWSVDVPEGKTVGGAFQSIPLCTKGGETGCVITYMSFRAASPPPAGSFLGRASRPGMTAGCTNPAALAGDGHHLDSYWFAALPPRQGEAPIAWSSQGEPPTPFVRTEGLVSGECRHDGSAGYLALTVNADPADARTDRIPGDVYMLGAVNPSWGMHLADMNVAQGNLIAAVEAQSRALLRGGR